MNAPLKVICVGKSGQREWLTKAEEMSSRGMYFLLPEKLKIGTAINFVLTLSPEDSREAVRMTGAGRVRRVEELPDGSFGIPASVDRYEFERPDQSHGFEP